jgi:hypothetical protein
MRLLRTCTAAALPLVLAAGCASGSPEKDADKVAQSKAQLKAAVSVRKLINPKRKYFGVYTEKNKDNSAAQIKGFGTHLGVKPNIVKHYHTWDQAYPAKWASATWKAGALPQVEIEPFGVDLGTIAQGKSDAYLVKYAKDVRKLNIPVTLSFGHEFNGWWYDWGTKKTTPAKFVAAWKHIHDVFKKQGATNVIWLWSPNVVYPMPKVSLKAYYPGNAYVDWVGLSGYYKSAAHAKFSTLFDPSIKVVRKFSKKPIILAETASPKGRRHNADIADLLTGIAKRKGVIGLIWFNLKKPGELDYRIESGGASSVKLFKRYLLKHPYGFNVKKP